MPEQGSIITTWDDFSQGDYGQLGGERAAKGTFHAENMLVYRDGGIGPRAGLKEVTPDDMPVGPLLGLVATPTPGRDGLFLVGKDVYYFDLFDSGSVTLIGSLDETPEQPLLFKQDTATFVLTSRFDDAGTSTSDGTYRITVDGSPSITKITDAPGGIDVTLYGQQMVVADSEFMPRVLGSSGTDPSDWSEGRFIDAGDNWQVTALHVIRNALTIIKRTGWFILQGVLGDADTERVTQVSTSDGVLHAWESSRDLEDRIWFWPLFRNLPAYYDGAVLRFLGNLQLDEARESDDTIAVPPLKRGVVVLQGDTTTSTVVFVQGATAQKALVNHNGKWTRHSWGTTVSGMLGQGGPISQQFLTTDGGSDSTAARIFTTLFNLNRPAFVSDGLASPGDDSATPLPASVTLPQWWAADGREVKLSQVVVDFKSWNTGTTETNHFDVTVRVLGRDRSTEAVRTTDGSPAPFDQATSVSVTAAAGTRQRHSFMFNCPPGAGIEITLSNVRGCEIRSVTAVEAKRTARPI